MADDYITRELTKREAAIVDLLWDYLKRDPEHKDRRRTDAGTKTKLGLARTIERIFSENSEPVETALRMVLAEKFYLPSPQRKLPLDHEDVTAAVEKFIAKAKR